MSGPSSTPSTNSSERVRTRSYANLDAARCRAQEQDAYSSTAIRRTLQRRFTRKFSKPAYNWQLDVAEAILLKVDCVLIAGTGAGKTIPFMLPLLGNDQTKMGLLVQPLKALMYEQVSQHPNLGYSVT
jgi:superfamily II DNA helicase RecQ